MNTTADPNAQAAAPTKHIFQSTTFWSAVIGIIVMFFPHLLDKLGVGDPSMLADKIVAAIGFLGVVYGRWKAGGIRFFLS